jgi:hypothetical protein
MSGGHDMHNDTGIPVDNPGYEVRDASIPGLIKFAVVLAIVLAVTLISMRFMFDVLGKLTPLGETASPFDNGRHIPAGPLVQAKPHQDLTSYCTGQSQAVSSYSWVNKDGGIVQIPVDRAMDLTMQRGLPSRSAADMAAAGATIPPVGAAGEPDATYLQGPCGYLTPPAEAEGAPKD